MTEVPQQPDDRTPRRQPLNGLMICGLVLIAISLCMFVIGGVLFAASVPEPIRPLLSVIGGISFWGFIPTGVLGLILLIVGAIRRRAA